MRPKPCYRGQKSGPQTCMKSSTHALLESMNESPCLTFESDGAEHCGALACEMMNGANQCVRMKISKCHTVTIQTTAVTLLLDVTAKCSHCLHLRIYTSDTVCTLSFISNLVKNYKAFRRCSPAFSLIVSSCKGTQNNRKQFTQSCHGLLLNLSFEATKRCYQAFQPGVFIHTKNAREMGPGFLLL